MPYPPGRTHYNKLIRDRVPDIMTAKGVTFAVQRIDDDAAFASALAAKLIEEANEFALASSDDRVAELADVLDVIDALVTHHRIAPAILARVRRAQNEKKGGFTQRLLLVWSEQPSSS